MDPLEWTHQWDDYEMMMYVETAGDKPGIFMQVTQRVRQDGAEQWEILYDRKLADYNAETGKGEPGSEEWEDAILRDYLYQHPHVVRDEKEYFQAKMEGDLDE